MATMKDIAEKAGVSQATVSRVLSGGEGVSPARRAIVMEWVRKLDFEPNRSARSLAASRSQLLGVMLPDLMNPYFTAILAHIERLAVRNGYSILLANSEGDIQKERQLFRSMKARQVDGLLVGLASPKSPILEDIREKKIKTVVVSQQHTGVDCVGVSHYSGGRQVAEHFLETGVEEFSFFGPDYDPKFMGFKETLLKSGIDPGSISVMGNEDWWLSHLDQGFHRAEDYLALRRREGRLGVLAVNDPFALGIVHAGQELGLDIPGELSVVGFDDTFICRNVRPTLSSVNQQTEEIGTLAVELLLRRIEGDLDDEDQHIQLEPRLIIRETS